MGMGSEQQDMYIAGILSRKQSCYLIATISSNVSDEQSSIRKP